MYNRGLQATISGPSLGCSLDGRRCADFQLRISDKVRDADWDSYVAETPGGYHTQTSAWGQVKALVGKDAVRVTAWKNGRIVGGAQMLIHSIPIVGAAGYVPRGPLFALGEPALKQLVIDGLCQVAKERSVQYLMVQPPNNDVALERRLLHQGFRSGSLSVASKATIELNLERTMDEILAQMKKTTRKYIRRGERRGLVGREGTEADLPAFYDLMTATSQRQKFPPFPRSYFSEMWRLLQLLGYVKFFIVEFEGEPVSAQIVIPFGDRVLTKIKGWSGRHQSLGPNYLMDWVTIKWAHKQGYRYYDFEGIDSGIAQSILDNALQPAQIEHGPTRYKLNFGGRVALHPGAYECIFNPLLRLGYTALFPRFSESQAVEWLKGHLRTA